MSSSNADDADDDRDSFGAVDLQEMDSFMASLDDTALTTPKTPPASPPAPGSSLFGDPPDTALNLDSFFPENPPTTAEDDDQNPQELVLRKKLDAMGFSATAVQKAMRDLEVFQEEGDNSGAFMAPRGAVDALLDRVLEGSGSVGEELSVDSGVDGGGAGDVLEELLNPSLHLKANPLALPEDDILGSSAFLRAQRKPRGGWIASPSRAADHSELFGAGGGREGEAAGEQAALFSKKEIPTGERRAEKVIERGSQRTALSDINGMSYEEFIIRLLRPESTDLLEYIRGLINSVLNAPKVPSREELRERLTEFYGAVEVSMVKHRAWGAASPPVDDDGLISARNWLEKFVMSKIGPICFVAVEEAEQDKALSRRMEELQLFSPEDLHVPSYVQNELSLELAAAELRKINGVTTPGEKVACVVKCATMIFSVLNLARKRGDMDSRPGADDFLPVFIYVVLQARVPKLQSNCAYIEAFHNPANLMSKAGYCFVNLCSAAAFIMEMDAAAIGMDAKDFEQKVAQAAAR